ncbi:MAG TPA: class E sortase [Streptomyces sp.]|nr:class E sortase [Streptomyces sp.]
MPPDRESPYGQPYGEPHGEGYPYNRSPYGQNTGPEEDPYAQSEDFQAAVDALRDPLSDPLPGQATGRGQGPGQQGAGRQGVPPTGQAPTGHISEGYSAQGYPAQGYPAHGQSQGHPREQQYAPQEQEGVSPWFRPHREPGEAAQTRGAPVQGGNTGSQVPYESTPYGRAPYESAPYESAAYESTAPDRQQWRGPGHEPVAGPAGPGLTGPTGPTAEGPYSPTAEWGRDAAPPGRRMPGQHYGEAAPTRTPAPAPEPEPRTQARPRRSRLSETAALPVVDEADIAGGDPSTPATSATSATPGREAAVADEHSTRTVGLRRPDAEALAGRAARRRAAQRRGHRGGGARDAPVRTPAGTRLEARRAARARREGPAIIASRLLGEVFISAGVLMLLFVAYQLWWTNVLAGQEAGGAAQDLQAQWKDGDGGEGSLDPERKADSFAPGEGFALLYIPKLDVRVPIAQGVSKPQVLDKGLVGHYDEEPVKSAMPWDKKGNFALAGHRNTHGEPFRYVNRLVAGDEMVVETATKFYTYKMANRLPSTSPSNTGVIDPVPQQSGFNTPGRYITLTTCTPEFTSKYRLIVWGKMVEERPRSKGKPDALVG